MRELLKRWAELEPGRCRLDENIESFAIKSGKWWGLVRLSDLSEGSSPIQVQAAVQEAIISRGWTLNLEWDGEWCAIIQASISETDLNSPAVALLGAYVKVLESRGKR